MRIIQMLPVMAFGDAIGNDTLSLDDTLSKSGFKAEIYAMYIDERLTNRVKRIDSYKCEPDDIILYHLSTGSPMNYDISEYDCKRIIMYHNITPGHFFAQYDVNAKEVCDSGLRAAGYLKKKADLCLADSEFNKRELEEMGYKCSIEVLPILIAFDDYKKRPSGHVIQKYSDDYVNIVFTGRVAPNKKHEDIISAFYYYKKYINPKSRLLLVGRHDFFPEYYRRLQGYVEKLELEDVIFTGQVKFDEILAYYKVADVFVCLSEHEGFCVPLVESMMFDVPIIAYDSCAVGETLGGSGLLLKDKSPQVIAEAIHLVVEDKKLKNQLIENQQKRLCDFQHDKIKEKFLNIMQEFIAGEKQ